MASNDLIMMLTGGLPIGSINDQLKDLHFINDALLAESIAAMQDASRAASPAGSGSGLGSVFGTIGDVIGSGLGFSPLISGLADLFGGGSDQRTPTMPTPYIRRLPIQLDAGFSGGATFGVDSVQGEAPRPITGNGLPQLVIQTFDSQWFLDHSNDIAMAVRQAMLESTVLNDVIREV